MRILVVFALFINSYSLYSQKLDETFKKIFDSNRKPSAFQENKGQVVDQDGKLRSDILFLYNAPGMKVQFKANSWSYEMYQLEETEELSEATLMHISKMNDPFDDFKKKPKNYNYISHRVDISLINSNLNSRIIVENPIDYTENFYKEYTTEEGVTNVKSYLKLTYKNIWYNIDIEWVAEETDLKYNIILHPGANPKDIQLAYQGADRLILIDGKIQTTVSFQRETGKDVSNLTESIPAVFGAEGADFSLKGNIVGYQISGWNGLSTAIIDPILAWGTYYGGNNHDIGADVYIDSKDNIIIVGSTTSSNSISTIGSHKFDIESFGGDAFISKFNSEGKLIWGTYFGGEKEDRIYGITIDKSDNIYITGQTSSKNGISTNISHQQKNQGDIDVIIAKFNSNGILIWGTYYGGNASDLGLGITIDNYNNLYICGITSSDTLIATDGTHQFFYNEGDGDIFISKFSSDGNLLWGSYYGGMGSEYCDAISTDIQGNIYITGRTSSNTNISTIGVHQEVFNGGSYDAFVAKFNSKGILVFGTYFGGSNTDFGLGIDVNEDGVFVVGSTNSFTSISTIGSHQENYEGFSSDAFLAKFNNLGKLDWGTYYGGNKLEYANNIKIEKNGSIWICGSTRSEERISTTEAFQTNYAGGLHDGFIAKFSKSGSLEWGSYYGGENNDEIVGFYSNVYGSFSIIGITNSNSGISSIDVHQSEFKGAQDIFISKFITLGYEDVKTIKINNPKDSFFCKADSFQLVVEIINQSTTDVIGFYYIFKLHGDTSFIDSVFIDTLKPNTIKTLSSRRYFHLKNYGSYTIKVYHSYLDDLRSNDSLSYNILVYSKSKPNIIQTTDTVCYINNLGKLNLEGSIGKVIKWQLSEDKGVTWKDIPNTNTVQTYENLTITTQYRAIVKKGSCSPDTSTISTITVIQNPNLGFSTKTNQKCVPVKLEYKSLVEEENIESGFIILGDTLKSDSGIFIISKAGNFIISQITIKKKCNSILSKNITVYNGISPTETVKNTYASYTDSGVLVRWGAVQGAARYRLQYADEELVTNDLEFLHKTTEQFDYNITAIDSCGNMSQTVKISPIYLTGSTNPQNFAANLRWTSYPTPDYCVERLNSDSSWENLGCVNSLNFSDEEFANDESYVERCYRVSSVTEPKSYSNVVCLPFVSQLWIPNAFSPNADRINDVWQLRGIGIKEIKVSVYNRWGQLVYEADSLSDSWDGDNAQEGVYLYIVQYQENSGRKRIEKGVLRVVR